jgi:hypothetical protein
LWLQQNDYPDLRLEDVQEEYSPDRYTHEKVKAEGLWKRLE